MKKWGSQIALNCPFKPATGGMYSFFYWKWIETKNIKICFSVVQIMGTWKKYLTILISNFLVGDISLVFKNTNIGAHRTKLLIFFYNWTPINLPDQQQCILYSFSKIAKKVVKQSTLLGAAAVKNVFDAFSSRHKTLFFLLCSYF